MKVVIFAGGVGTRLWPLSRKSTPKQFEKIIGDRSTLQETIVRLTPEVDPKDIYLATGARYKDIVMEQLPQIPKENFIFEPTTRDVGPAIGLVASLLAKKFPDEPITILWCDHLVKHVEVFKQVLHRAQVTLEEKKSDFVFIAQKPRFPNQNIGWIELGEEIENDTEIKVSNFKRLKYRPKLSDAQSFFKEDRFVWNLGYFVTTPSFLLSLYEKFAPDMYTKLQTIAQAQDGDGFETTLQEIYPTFEKISFDDVILEKLSPKNISVISADLGWSDVGAWEALKEALSDSEEENVTKGNVMLEDSVDSLAFNYGSQLVVGIDLKEMLVVTTEDVILVCPKDSVPKIKKLVESLAGSPNEHLA